MDLDYKDPPPQLVQLLNYKYGIKHKNHAKLFTYVVVSVYML